jgi:sigma-B regulation protein RsbU (phosphoserine phosphatase)
MAGLRCPAGTFDFLLAQLERFMLVDVGTMNRDVDTVLVVDDEALNLMLIKAYLQSGRYRLVTAGDGAEAWAMLQADPRGYDVVLLDLMMPRMDGMEVLKRIKSHPQLRVLPVILQTALASPKDIHRGIKAGAYYYLTKPFEREMLRSVVATAAKDHARYRRMQEQIDTTSRLCGLLHRADFRYRTLEEGRALAQLLANACPDPRKAVVGLGELMVNAVEHGNLGIGYREKGRLLEAGELAAEVQRRIALPEYRDRCVAVSYRRSEREIRIQICDQGAGFDWENYAEVDASRVFDAHGRGIAVARIMSFDRVEFAGRGNEVTGFIRVRD